MVRLLVSVVDASEVAAAVAGGADIVDVKNPREGSLGAPQPSIVRAVRAATPPHVPVSVAIGDMPDMPGTAALAALGAVVAGASYVKMGLRGSSEPAAVFALIQAAVQAIAGTGGRLIATAYADGTPYDLLPPLALPDIAADAGADGCMLDTLQKGGSSLRRAQTDHELMSFVARSRHHGLVVALAGSLMLQDLPWLTATLTPDIVGVRGAACTGTRRDGTIDRARVAALKASLKGQPPTQDALD